MNGEGKRERSGESFLMKRTMKTTKAQSCCDEWKAQLDCSKQVEPGEAQPVRSNTSEGRKYLPEASSR